MAILAEKYAVDYTWYVDVILNLIRISGDYVSEEVSGRWKSPIIFIYTAVIYIHNDEILAIGLALFVTNFLSL